MQDPTAGATSAQERVLDVVPGLDELIERGAPGDQVQSQPLAAGASEQAWLLWFVRHRHGLVILTPLAGIRPDAVADALARCNEHNAAMEWSTLSVAPWEHGQVASLSVRLPLPSRLDDVWDMIGGSMQHVLEAAGPARERLSDLIED